MMKRSIRGLPLRIASVLVVVAALVLSGCVDAELKSEFNEDGGATHTYTLEIEKEAMESLGSMGGEGTEEMNFDDVEEQAREQGLEAERIDTDEVTGFRVWKDVEDSSDLGETFNEIFAGSADEGAEAPTDAITGTFEKDGDEFNLNLVIDSDKMFGSSGLDETGQDPASMEGFITFTYVAVMPGEVKETNGEKVGDNQVRWELPLTGTTELTAVSEGSSSGGSGTIVLIALLGLLVLGGLIAAWLFTQRRRGPRPAVATATPTAAGPMTATTPGATYPTEPAGPVTPVVTGPVVAATDPIPPVQTTQPATGSGWVDATPGEPLPPTAHDADTSRIPTDTPNIVRRPGEGTDEGQ